MEAAALRLRRTWDYSVIRSLDRQCLPEDAPMADETLPDSAWWLAVSGSQVVGYGGLYLALEGEGWLVRAGVLRVARGLGLQRRLIRVRVQHAARLGLGRVLTYTSSENIPSQRNLVACGFKPYRGEEGIIYFERRLQKPSQAA